MLKNCFICNNQANIESRAIQDVFDVTCPVCGKYAIDGTSSISIPEMINDELFILSGIIRDRSTAGLKTELRDDKIEDLISSFSLPNDPLDKINRIISYLLKETKSADEFKDFNPLRDYPIAFARNPKEFEYYLMKGIELNLLEEGTNYRNVRLSITGWKRAIELKSNKYSGNQAFVAMWFDSKLTDAWNNGFKEALISTGYNPLRIDILEHNEKICDKIIAEIRKSTLLVADFTGNRGGVYFEVGFAMGLGIDVIWTCHKDFVNELHFDTRQYNHIVWESVDDLKEKLKNRIEATNLKK